MLEHERPQNLVQVLQEKGYNSFANALKATKLDKVIDHEGHFTVFAPTNEAFDNPKAYPQDTTLNERVAYYIVRGLIKESMVSDELMVPSLLSKRQLRFNVYQEEVSFFPHNFPGGRAFLCNNLTFRMMLKSKLSMANPLLSAHLKLTTVLFMSSILALITYLQGMENSMIFFEIYHNSRLLSNLWMNFILESLNTRQLLP